jgi:hypothetical protein
MCGEEGVEVEVAAAGVVDTNKRGVVKNQVVEGVEVEADLTEQQGHPSVVVEQTMDRVEAQQSEEHPVTVVEEMQEVEDMGDILIQLEDGLREEDRGMQGDKCPICGFIKEFHSLFHMEIEYFTEPISFCIIRNYVSSDEVQAILKELEELKPRLQSPENTGTAHDGTGKPKKSNKGLFIDNYATSAILKINRKLFGEVAWETSKHHWFFKMLKEDVEDSTLVSYYENGDYYKKHHDTSIITAIHYVWNEPKSFEGGDLYFGEFKVPITNNCLVVFPGACTEHQVTPVTGTGRWAISQFVHQKSTKQSPVPIIQFPNFLSVMDFRMVQRHVENAPWSFKGFSNETQKGKFWYMDLMDMQPFREYIFGLIEKVAGRKFKLHRVYANGQAYGQDGDYHQDDTDPKSWTFILYTNDILPNEIDDWGGATLFKTDNGIMYQPPITNLGILFRSDLWHRGLAPSKHINELRRTVAWKLSEL